METYAQKKERLMREMRAAAGTVRLEKDTSNLFREREEAPQARLNVRDFNTVIEVNAKEGWADVEGMTPYDALVDETLKHGYMPAVVPELKSITIGGAISGLGIEASSFRYGLVHETVLEMDVLLSDGRVVTCTPENEHRDLFLGIPNSFGTLGYVLRVRALLVRVKPYVRITHTYFSDPKEFFGALESLAKRRDIDFLEGEIFSETEHYISTGVFTDAAPYTSDYTYLNVYYHSIKKRTEDFLSVHDYLWRWDTDWFWDSKFYGAENSLIRRLLGRRRLNSRFYMRALRWYTKQNLLKKVIGLFSMSSESVIQDIPIPAGNAVDFLSFFHKEIGIKPVWICPIGEYAPDRTYPLFPLSGKNVYFNFGFWDVVKTPHPMPEGHFNKLIEKKIAPLGGIKSLYSSSYYTREEFWKRYDENAYKTLKQKYDPSGKLKGLYEKTVKRG